MFESSEEACSFFTSDYDSVLKKKENKMTLEFSLYWSFRSPYSYLAMKKLRQIKETYDLNIIVKPVYPIAIRKADFFKTVDPQWMPYLQMDVRRIAKMEDIPFFWPKPDPIIQDLETRKISSDQPYIFRLTNLGIAACRRGKGLAFLHEASACIFGGTLNWHEGDHLAQATRCAGLDLDELEAEIQSDKMAIEAEIQSNQAEQHGAGHWGVPLMVFEGEPFFGQDRIDLLVWRMKEAGLQLRK
jgi:2-hydroxychromene-2-carboxylate isomerase